MIKISMDADPGTSICYITQTQYRYRFGLSEHVKIDVQAVDGLLLIRILDNELVIEPQTNSVVTIKPRHRVSGASVGNFLRRITD